MAGEFTRKDAERLRELRDDTKAIETRERAALEKIMTVFNAIPGMPQGSWQVTDVVGRADAIRDALEPFDSGVRAREVPDA